jgi:hypothetical protein
MLIPEYMNNSYSEYMDNSKSQTPPNEHNPIHKWANELNRHFTKEEVQINGQ